MSDRELLEKAAKAAGLVPVVLVSPGHIFREAGADDSQGFHWNPLTDDGDALRLACALGLVVDCSRPSAGLPFYSHEFRETGAANTAEGVRRAIVRAAAAIWGVAQPGQPAAARDIRFTPDRDQPVASPIAPAIWEDGP